VANPQQSAIRSLLFRRYHFPLDGLLIVGAPTCRTQAVHVVLDVVEAELTDLVWVLELVLRLEELVHVRRTWYPQGHGLKFLSERSNSSMQRGLNRNALARQVEIAYATRRARQQGKESRLPYQTSSSSSMKLSWGDIVADYRGSGLWTKRRGRADEYRR
jgi:hypothetical protein